jgi:hypothetical protein
MQFRLNNWKANGLGRRATIEQFWGAPPAAVANDLNFTFTLLVLFRIMPAAHIHI